MQAEMYGTVIDIQSVLQSIPLRCPFLQNLEMSYHNGWRLIELYPSRALTFLRIDKCHKINQRLIKRPSCKRRMSLKGARTIAKGGWEEREIDDTFK
jgi:hypothetical protein